MISKLLIQKTAIIEKVLIWKRNARYARKPTLPLTPNQSIVAAHAPRKAAKNRKQDCGIGKPLFFDAIFP